MQGRVYRGEGEECKEGVRKGREGKQGEWEWGACEEGRRM